jgi:hypothetical protein
VRHACDTCHPMAAIDDYSFGHIVIDGRTHSRDVIVLPTRIVSNWWRKDGHSLVMDDLTEVLDELPERLIVGCGANARLHPDPGTLKQLELRGIDVEVAPTADAVRLYRDSDPSSTAAALHLTC